MDRYQVEIGSVLRHCCHKYSVIDTAKADDENYENLMCECLTKDAADQIALALNLMDNDARQDEGEGREQ